MINHWYKFFRMKQWVKNAFVLVPLVFSHQMFNTPKLMAALIAVGCFCAVSSLIYILNDWNDRDVDRQHPQKSTRPLAAGVFGFRHVLFGVILCASVPVTANLFLSLPNKFFVILGFYGLNSILYTYFIKELALIEAFSVATGYVLRVLAGVAAIDTDHSVWLLFAAGSVALTIVMVKRRSEQVNFTDSTFLRSSLDSYSPEFLNLAIGMSAVLTIVSYCLFTISTHADARYGHELMPASSIIVIFGVMRFLMISYRQNPDEDPTSSILSDRVLLATVGAWGAFILILLYFPG